MTKGKIALKICGMGNPENVRNVASLRPDYLGFIFYPGSKRFVGANFMIPSGLPKEVKRVGVFVDEPVEKMKAKVDQHQLDYLQLHGDESVDVCENLKSGGIRIIKTFGVNDHFDFNQTIPFEGVADYFLFDTGGKTYGGSGQTFNWNLLSKYNQKIPFFLGGGLSLDNIASVRTLNGMNLHGLDVNSKVEAYPGVKDVDLVKKMKMEVADLKLNFK